MKASPLILTLHLNEEAFSFFNSLRQQYFPAERNFLNAHLTLFHHLPPNEQMIVDSLAAATQTQEKLLLDVVGVVTIGKGVAYKIVCPSLLNLHRILQQKWQPWLLPQDRQKLWPHITVQNKVAPAIAKQTLEVLKEPFEPFTAQGIGLTLWRYEGGPWEFVQDFPFKQAYRF